MKKAIFFAATICFLLISLIYMSCTSSPKGLSAYDHQVKELLDQMTLEEKIGQMTQPEQDQVLKNPGDMQKYFIGSVLSGGNSDPAEGNGLEAWTDLYDKVQEEAIKTRLAIPVLYGIDAVHGHSNVQGSGDQAASKQRCGRITHDKSSIDSWHVCREMRDTVAAPTGKLIHKGQLLTSKPAESKSQARPCASRALR